MWNSSSSLSGEQAESCHQEPWAGVQPTITLNPCYPSGLRSGSGSTEVDGRVLLGSSAQPAPACTVGDLRPVLSPTFLSRGMRRRLVLLPAEPFPRTPTPSNTPRANWNDWGWGDRPAGFTLTFQSHLCASQPSTKSQKNSFMELNREEAAFGLERVPAGVLQWPAPPKLQNRKEIPGSSSETWRRACPTCLAGSQAGGTEDSHPWLSHIVRGRSPGCTSLPSLLLDGSPHLERSPERPGSPKSPADPHPGPFRTTLMTPLMLHGFPGPWARTDQAIWGKRKAAGLWPPAEEVGEGGLALFWPGARAVGFIITLGPANAWSSFFILRP